MILERAEIAGLPCQRGKVRDKFDLGESILMVTSDRVSAFDVVLPTPIPGKGEALNQLSLYWFGRTADIIRNHVITSDVRVIIQTLDAHGIENSEQYKEMLEGRSVLVHKADPSPIECVVRGFLGGSAWKEYRRLEELAVQKEGTGEVDLYGITLPVGMVEYEKLPKAVFTPSTKEESGHDINISMARAREIVGAETADLLEQASIALYERGVEVASEVGLDIYDTKFEFGLCNGVWIQIDESLTSDSSRYGDKRLYRPGGPQESFDKQFLRDYLEDLCSEGKWNKEYPGPELPKEIVEKTREKYLEAYRLITGEKLAA